MIIATQQVTNLNSNIVIGKRISLEPESLSYIHTHNPRQQLPNNTSIASLVHRRLIMTHLFRRFRQWRQRCSEIRLTSGQRLRDSGTLFDERVFQLQMTFCDDRMGDRFVSLNGIRRSGEIVIQLIDRSRVCCDETPQRCDTGFRLGQFHLHKSKTDTIYVTNSNLFDSEYTHLHLHRMYMWAKSTIKYKQMA